MVGNVAGSTKISIFKGILKTTGKMLKGVLLHLWIKINCSRCQMQRLKMFYIMVKAPKIQNNIRIVII